MTYTELQAEVRARLNESTATFWANTDIQNAINEGYLCLSEASEWKETSTALSVSANTVYLNTESDIAAGFLSPRQCRNSTTRKWLMPASITYLDTQVNSRWEALTGQQDYFFMRGLLKFGLAPKSGASNTLTLYHSVMPAVLSSGSDTPGFPQEFHYGIVEYALYDCLVQEGEISKALLHWAQYEKQEKDLTAYVNGRLSLARTMTLNG